MWIFSLVLDQSSLEVLTVLMCVDTFLTVQFENSYVQTPKTHIYHSEDEYLFPLQQSVSVQRQKTNIYEMEWWRTNGLASKEKKNPVDYVKESSFSPGSLSRSVLFCVTAGAFFCRADEFICNNTLCKLQTWVCDGKDDCGDNSDEDASMCGTAGTVAHEHPFEDIP